MKIVISKSGEDCLSSPAVEAIALVVEDDPVVSEVIERMLARLGIEVFTAHNSMQALDCIAKHGEQLSLVVMDYSIPGMETGRFLRTLRKLTRPIKILVTSGYSLAQIKQDLDEATFESFLQKPYEPEIFMSEVSRLLSANTPK